MLLIFHSYELLIIIWILIAMLGLSDVWKAAAIGLTQHIIFDQFTNPLRSMGYFMTYRAFKKFSAAHIIKQ